jgi:hypothetical protein
MQFQDSKPLITALDSISQMGPDLLPLVCKDVHEQKNRARRCSVLMDL